MSTLVSELQIDQTDPIESPRKVAVGAPLAWLRSGIKDFRTLPLHSLLYGALFAVLCALVLFFTRNAPWFTLAYLTGLVVIGPFVAAGLYAASRSVERGEKASIVAGFRLIYQRRTYLTLFVLMLSLVMAAWVRFSALLFAVTSNGIGSGGTTGSTLLALLENPMSLAFFVGTGLLLVTVVFIYSAVAIPLILDRDVDFISAMRTSYRAVTRNPAAMFVWASLIVALTAVGVMTALIGLVVIFPVLGYATWHSYRALVP